jgi:hypothetical protein
VVDHTQESKDKFKATLGDVLAPFNRQPGSSASDFDAAVARVSSVLFRTVEEAQKKKDRRGIAGITVSRNAAKKLLGNLDLMPVLIILTLS